jgi:4-aminobutyrate aminotransferase-like enzyme
MTNKTGFNFSLSPQKVASVATRHRKISTGIPAPGTQEVLEQLSKYESRSMHGQLPIVWDKADEFYVYDIAGNQWIDFTSTIFVANVGHSNKRVSEEIRKTLNYPLYSCYAYANRIRADYLKRLIKFAGKPFEKAFLMSAGTESTEAALKLMRMYGQKAGKRRPGIVCIDNNWHGRTLGAQMMSSNKAQKQWIGYQDENIHHIPFPYPWDLGNKTGEDFLYDGLALLNSRGIDLERDICGFMLESFQGWGAVFYPDDFVKGIERVARDKNILLAFDEMQAGFGRTGKAFGYQHYGVTPDLIACGKGMGGGVPLSGVIGRAEIMDLPSIGNMSSTHSANPLVCAAGLAVIDELEERSLISVAESNGLIFKAELEKLKDEFSDRISYVLGKGMIYAVLFKDPLTSEPDALFTSKLAERCMQKGLLVVHTGRESLKLGPPLTISLDALVEGVSVIREAIQELLR